MVSWFQVILSWFWVRFSWVFMVPGWFSKVPGRVFMVPGWFSWFSIVPGWFLWFWVGFHGSRFVFMVSGLFSVVFHGSWYVFHGFSPKFTRPNCILAPRSSLGPPPGGRHRT